MKSLREYLPESFLIELGEGPTDSSSPVSGAHENPSPADSMDGHRAFKEGDPVVIKNMKYEGKTGKIIDLTNDNKIAEVEFKDGSSHRFNVADLSYDDYANDQDPEESFKHQLANFKKLAGY